MHTTLTNCTALYKDEDVEAFRSDEQDQTLIHFLQEENIQLIHEDCNSIGSSSDVNHRITYYNKSQ